MPQYAATGATSPDLSYQPMSNNLPPSILRRIFEHVSTEEIIKCAQTCRHWAIPALKIIWQHLKFIRTRDFDRTFAIIARKNTIFPYGTFVKSIEIIHAERELSISSQMMLLVVSLCHDLEAISLNFSNVRAGPKMEQSSTPPKKALPPPQMIQHRVPTKTVTTADTHTQPLPLAHIGHNCPSIHTLRLDSYVPKNDDSIYEMAKYLNHGTLRNIRFTGCTTLQGSTLRKLAKMNPQMRHIEILGNTPITDSTTVTLAEECRLNLQHLVIGNAYHLTDKAFLNLAHYCSNLHHLSLYNTNSDAESLSENGLIQIVKKCSSLSVLNISNARWLGEAFFEEVLIRVKRQLQEVEEPNSKLTASYGLHQICLGNVRREILRSPTLQKLIELSSYSDDFETSDDDEYSTAFEAPVQVPFMSNEALPPNARKMNVVRGSSIWWYRRQPRVSQATN
ncbi:hypothetical protein K450DRAFT_216434 [Umbelopsis ramanniana AG]|uniref:F-box domain-containing protein n=1 Tax=Umbelopsis ramanniana AG TaxID=1314678 RepID=A0AAD5EK41_UMBRA|nr:uncharacterized protein K450DRAFT_216434 [Umbelopsis ramanniana AG]KAI8584441.1 hypothetical protein K450DRAFT_216434 [Umbelopsis ramanniana AG]